MFALDTGGKHGDDMILQTCAEEEHVLILDEDYCSPLDRACLCGESATRGVKMLLLGPKSPEAHAYYADVRPWL